MGRPQQTTSSSSKYNHIQIHNTNQLNSFKVKIMDIIQHGRHNILSIHSSTVTRVLGSGRCRGQELCDFDPRRCRGRGHSIYQKNIRTAITTKGTSKLSVESSTMMKSLHNPLLLCFRINFLKHTL